MVHQAAGEFRLHWFSCPPSQGSRDGTQLDAARMSQCHSWGTLSVGSSQFYKETSQPAQPLALGRYYGQQKRPPQSVLFTVLYPWKDSSEQIWEFLLEDQQKEEKPIENRLSTKCILSALNIPSVDLKESDLIWSTGLVPSQFNSSHGDFKKPGGFLKFLSWLFLLV